MQGCRGWDNSFSTYSGRFSKIALLNHHISSFTSKIRFKSPSHLYTTCSLHTPLKWQQKARFDRVSRKCQPCYLSVISLSRDVKNAHRPCRIASLQVLRRHWRLQESKRHRQQTVFSAPHYLPHDVCWSAFYLWRDKFYRLQFSVMVCKWKQKDFVMCWNERKVYITEVDSFGL